MLKGGTVSPESGLLIDKPNKPKEKMDSYRSITLVNTIGKLFCKILNNRLKERISAELNRVEQHAFTSGRSTQSAIKKVTEEIKKKKFGVAIAIDIKSAFDQLSWSQIRFSLGKTGVQNEFIRVVDQMLIGRTVSFGESKRVLYRGVPQEDTSSPTLWNVAMWLLLNKLKKIKNLMPVSFANDLLLLIEAKSIRELMAIFGRTKRIVMNWCREAGLRISHQNSQMMQFSGTGLTDITWCCVEESEQIEMVAAISYLNLMLDKNPNWKEQVDHVEKKLLNSSNMMNRIFRSRTTTSPREKLMLYRVTTIAILTYAAEFWYTALEMMKYKNRLNAT